MPSATVVMASVAEPRSRRSGRDAEAKLAIPVSTVRASAVRKTGSGRPGRSTPPRSGAAQAIVSRGAACTGASRRHEFLTALRGEAEPIYAARHDLTVDHGGQTYLHFRTCRACGRRRAKLLAQALNLRTGGFRRRQGKLPQDGHAEDHGI